MICTRIIVCIFGTINSVFDNGDDIYNAEDC